MSLTYMAVDPGKSGGIAFLKADFSQIAVHVMPVMGKDIDGRQIGKWIKHYCPTMAVIEKSQAMPKQGVTSMFNYGTGYGLIRGVLEGIDVPYSLVTPQAWKKCVLAGTKKDKDAAIQFVTRMFPDLDLRKNERCKNKHDGKADATCIAVHAVRTWYNEGK